MWLGIAMLVLGIVYHVGFMRGLRKEREQMHAHGLVHAESHFPVSMTLIIAILLLSVGIVACLQHGLRRRPSVRQRAT